MELAEELGLTKSQVIDEALGLFLKVVLEARRGRRLVTVAGEDNEPLCEIATPTLALLEWVSHRQALTLSPEAVERMERLVEEPPEPTPALRAAMAGSGG